MLKRKLQAFKIIPRILVVCEGRVTEGIYLNGVRIKYKIPKDLLQLRLGQGNPKTLVDLAVDLKKENYTENSVASGGRVDEVWCVFDRDDHEHIADAQQKAKANGIKIAFSNPCFELFLLLHFCDSFADLHRDTIRKQLRSDYLPGYEKTFDFGQVKNRYQDAKRRAEIVNARSEIKNQIQSAPFCSVPRLIDLIVPSHQMKRDNNFSNLGVPSPK